MPAEPACRRGGPAGGVDDACSDSTTSSNATPIGFVLAIIAVASIGGIVEIAPLFTIDETVEDAPDMRVYTPLELAGRNIYIREGCYACHSPDDPHAARRGRALRPLLAGRRIQIRPSDAVGLEAHRARTSRASAANIPTPGMSRISSIRATWCRNRSCRPIAGCCARRCETDDLGAHLQAQRARRRALYRRDDRERRHGRLRPGRAGQRRSPTASTKRYGEATTGPRLRRRCPAISPRWTRWSPICRCSAT